MLSAVCKLHNVDIFKPKTPIVIISYHFQCFIKTSIYWKILSKICLKDDTVFFNTVYILKNTKWGLKRGISCRMQFSGMYHLVLCWEFIDVSERRRRFYTRKLRHIPINYYALWSPTWEFKSQAMKIVKNLTYFIAFWPLIFSAYLIPT